MRRFTSALRYARTNGLRALAQLAAFRLTERWNEWRLRVHTAEFYEREVLGYRDRDLHEYTPAPYRALYYGLPELSSRAHGGAFLDYGAGMGRAMAVALRFPFSRVIGVELHEGLADAARDNLRRQRADRAARSLVVTADAREYQVPDDVMAIHLYNPFAGKVLHDVVQRIHESLLRAPRTVWLLYGNPGAFEETEDTLDWVSRVTSRSIDSDTRYTLYRCSPNGS